MFSLSTLEKLNRPKRTVWSDKTKELLKVIAEKRKALDIEEHEVRSRCNHTRPDGTSSMEERMGEGSHYDRCLVCGSTTEER